MSKLVLIPQSVFVAALVLGALVLLSGCTSDQVRITGSGNVVTLQEDFIDFDRLVVGHAFCVQVQQGDDFRVLVRVDENVQDYVRVVQESRTLAIGLQPGYAYNLRRVTLEAEVTLPRLAGLELSGASSLAGQIDTGDARFEVSGASGLSLSGSAQDVFVGVSGSSEADLSALQVHDATVELSGASSATVNPSGTLDVDASGASRLYYTGNPILGTVNLSGASDIQRK